MSKLKNYFFQLTKKNLANGTNKLFINDINPLEKLKLPRYRGSKEPKLQNCPCLMGVCNEPKWFM